jgi:hypothetical protein
MRDDAGGFYFNSIFTAYPDRAIDVENFENAATFDSFTQYGDGNLKVENNLFFDFGRGATFDDITDAGYSDENPTSSGAADDDAFAAYMAGANTIADPMLGGIGRDQSNSLDPRPATTSPAASGADFSFDELDDDFFDEVDFLGAFDPSDDGTMPTWLAGWTALAQTGYLTSAAVANEGTPEAAGLALAVGPNPTRGDATVRFSLDQAQRVEIALYDVLGRRVATVAEGAFAAGAASATVPTATLSTGVYVLRLQGETGAVARQLSVVR